MNQPGLDSVTLRFVVIFCNGLHLLQREVSLLRVRSTLNCEYKDRYVCIIYYGLCYLREEKWLVVGSYPRPRASPWVVG